MCETETQWRGAVQVQGRLLAEFLPAWGRPVFHPFRLCTGGWYPPYWVQPALLKDHCLNINLIQKPPLQKRLGKCSAQYLGTLAQPIWGVNLTITKCYIDNQLLIIYTNGRKCCPKQSKSDNLQVVLLSLWIKWWVCSSCSCVIYTGKYLGQVHYVAPITTTPNGFPPQSKQLICSASHPSTGLLFSSHPCFLLSLQSLVLRAAFSMLPLLHVPSQPLHGPQTHLVQVSAEFPWFFFLKLHTF